MMGDKKDATKKLPEMAVKVAHSNRIKLLALPNSHLVKAVLKEHYHVFNQECRERLEKLLEVILTLNNRNNVNGEDKTNQVLQDLKSEIKRLEDAKPRTVDYLGRKLRYSTSDHIRKSKSKELHTLYCKSRNVINKYSNGKFNSEAGGDGHLSPKREIQSPTATKVKFVESKSTLQMNYSNPNFCNKNDSTTLKQRNGFENLEKAKHQKKAYNNNKNPVSKPIIPATPLKREKEEIKIDTSPERPISLSAVKSSSTLNLIVSTSSILHTSYTKPLTAKPLSTKIYLKSSAKKLTTARPISIESTSKPTPAAPICPESITNPLTSKPSTAKTPTILKSIPKLSTPLTPTPAVAQKSLASILLNNKPLIFKLLTPNHSSLRTSTRSKHHPHHHKKRDSANPKDSSEDTKVKPNSGSEEEKNPTNALHDNETRMNLLKDMVPFTSSSRKTDSTICCKCDITPNIQLDSSSIKADTIHVKNPRVDKNSAGKKMNYHCGANTGRKYNRKNFGRELEFPDRSYLARLAVKYYVALISDMQKNCTIYKKFSNELIRPLPRDKMKCVETAYDCLIDYLAYMKRAIEVLHPHVTELIVKWKTHKKIAKFLEFDTLFKLLISSMRNMLPWKKALRNTIASYDKELGETPKKDSYKSHYLYIRHYNKLKAIEMQKHRKAKQKSKIDSKF